MFVLPLSASLRVAGLLLFVAALLLLLRLLESPNGIFHRLLLRCGRKTARPS